MLSSCVFTWLFDHRGNDDRFTINIDNESSFNPLYMKQIIWTPENPCCYPWSIEAGSLFDRSKFVIFLKALSNLFEAHLSYQKKLFYERNFVFHRSNIVILWTKYLLYKTHNYVKLKQSSFTLKQVP
jgi:hypothetical protein